MQLECYFSHSWAKEDVDLNIFVWETIADSCVLYVDREGADGGAYYINRLEELIRKSDVFVSVLAYREGDTPEDGRPDYQLACSPGALFEIRLAERARKPRWIIYDERTGFEQPDARSDNVVYTPIAADEELERGGRTIREHGARWLKSVSELLKSRTPRIHNAAMLLDDQADVPDIQRALKSATYRKVQRIEPAHTDAEIVGILQNSSLLVADIGAPSSREIYAMAHAMFVPSIRFMREEQKNAIPRLLEGHPGGYQHDLIFATNTKNLAEEVKNRAKAMSDKRKKIEDKKAGCAYLRRRLYRQPHQLFFSHNLAAADADLLRLVFDNLDNLGVRAWEYRNNNRAGVVWKDELKMAIDDATDVAFIFGNEFELSEVCAKEMKSVLDRREAIKSITPFLWGGRTKPNPEFSNLHHESLPADKAAAAEVIVDRVVKPLLAT